MTTARDVIAPNWFYEWRTADVGSGATNNEAYVEFIAYLQAAPESVRQELVALLNLWRPIETAPSSGECLLWAISKSVCAGYRASGKVWRALPNGGIVPFSPTHWLPLPAPPSEEKT